jgi:hypothetical protein
MRYSTIGCLVTLTLSLLAAPVGPENLNQLKFLTFAPL